MQPSPQYRSATPSADALWLVKNGTVTVGPVATNLLLRGVIHERVPSSSWVRQPAWHGWRELSKIREVSALQRVLARECAEASLLPATVCDSSEALAQASDPSEVLLIALHVAARVTCATVGLLHRVRAPSPSPTTSCAFGAACEHLGEVLPSADPAFALARSGCVRLLAGAGLPGSPEHASSGRLSEGEVLAGIALVPITVRDEFYAFLELGRCDHPFRAADAGSLAKFAEQVATALPQRTTNARG